MAFQSFFFVENTKILQLSSCKIGMNPLWTLFSSKAKTNKGFAMISPDMSLNTETVVLIYNNYTGHLRYLYVGAALPWKKNRNQSKQTSTNTGHSAFLTLEPANIVFSSFVPFPIPTTAKTERNYTSKPALQFIMVLNKGEKLMFKKKIKSKGEDK